MSTEVRFLLAIGLMLLVLVGSNLLFPPVPPPQSGQDAVPGEVTGEGAPAGQPGEARPEAAPGSTPATPGAAGEGAAAADTAGQAGPGGQAGAARPGGAAAGEEPQLVPQEDVAGQAEEELPPRPPEQRVRVTSPIYDFEFSSYGGRLVQARLPLHRSLREEGPVRLVPEEGGVLGHRLVVGQDTVDLREVDFAVEPAAGIELEEGDGPRELTFRYTNPATGGGLDLVYTFRPDRYVVDVEGTFRGIGRGLVLTEMGRGLAYNEADSAQEAGMMAWVGNHLTEGIDSESLEDLEERRLENGPYLWAAFKSKFFVIALLPGAQGGEDDYLGGVLIEPEGAAAQLSAAQNLGGDGVFDYAFFAGPQDYARLQALGDELEDVNPYGWRWLRPVLRPIVGGIIWILSFLHDNLNIGYGWVLILFGVMMRVALWPLNQKAMRAQLRNMQVQPLVKEIQSKYKDQPEKLQKEMMRLYKEHGFNPLGGCLPMLLPWPILIALFFVFQNTIEFRGVEFLWLNDLSAKDPYFILPIFLAVSMFLLQYISYRSMDQDNPQMKMMMYFMPPFMGFIFMNFAAGLNLYYATSQVATIPQQFYIAKERKKAKKDGPIQPDEGGDD